MITRLFDLDIKLQKLAELPIIFKVKLTYRPVLTIVWNVDMSCNADIVSAGNGTLETSGTSARNGDRNFLGYGRRGKKRYTIKRER